MKLHFIHDWSSWSEIKRNRIVKHVPSWEPIYSATFAWPYPSGPTSWKYVGIKQQIVNKYIQQRHCFPCNKKQIKEVEEWLG